MKTTPVYRLVFYFCVLLFGVFVLADDSHARKWGGGTSSNGGSVKVYYGLTTSYTPAVNSGSYTAPVVTADGSGGGSPAVSIAGTTYTNTSTYSTAFDSYNVSVSVKPGSGYKVASIRLIKYSDGSDDQVTDIAVADPPTGTTSFTVTLRSAVKYILLVDYDSNTSYTVTYTIDPDVTASPATTCNSTASITPDTPYTVSAGNTGVAYTITNSNSSCQVDAINFNSTGYSTDGWNATTHTYQTPNIIANSSFKVRFRGANYQVSTVVDPTGSLTCGGITPSATTFYGAGTSPVYTVTRNIGCAIESFKDNGTIVSLTASNTYTLTNLSANHTLTVKFVAVAATTGSNYCQVPPFMDGQNILKPNVLIILDTSGSMANNPYSSKTYNCVQSSTTSNCTQFYGYFDNAKMYKLATGTTNKYLIDTATTLNLASPTGTGTGRGLSGNYLNYKNMRKVDIMRKILVGGQVDPNSGSVRNSATGGTNTRYLLTDNGRLIEYGSTDPTGLVHQVYNKVRLGLMVFNSNTTSGLNNDGASLSAPIGSDLNTLVSKVESGDTDPDGYTPLAESLYEAVRYFQGGTSAYNSYDEASPSTSRMVQYNGTATDSLDPHHVYAKPVQGSCQSNYIILITDGAPTNDTNVPTYTGATVTDTSFTNWWTTANATTPKPSNLLGRVAYYAHNFNLSTNLSTWGQAADPSKLQSISLFTVFSFGDTTGATYLNEAAKFGAYLEDKTVAGTNKNGKPDVATEYTSPTDSTMTRGYFEADDGTVLESQLISIFDGITSNTASGTAAAVANNKSGQRGANMIQALFYPQFPSNNTVKWLGEVQALWYYLDPLVNYSSIFEDSNNDARLNLLTDSLLPSDPFDTKALWKAGAKLQTTNAADRNIYTPLNTSVDLTSGTTNQFSTANTATLKSLLNVSSLTDTQTNTLINYLRGVDDTVYRKRTVDFTNPSTGTTTSGVWKLGDIVNSTPIVQSSIPINSYNTTYADTTYGSFIGTTLYKGRNVVYTGSNDGMLHAFRMGQTSAINDASQPFLVAKMTGTDLGKEEWAFIPKNALPYLQNQCGTDYCHQYTVDGAPNVVDASIAIPTTCSETTDYWKCAIAGTSWKTVLVGSMGLGGASRDSAGSCNRTYDSVNFTDCVKSPVTGNGQSSYFALDVTDPLAPKYMWEFSNYSIADAADKGLGFTTSGAAIIRISTPSVGGNKSNGRWFAVLASGPTGAIDSAQRYFSGHSDQNLKIYIVDLNAGSSFSKCTAAAQTGCNYWVKDTGIPFAFANSLNGSAIDLDRWSQSKAGNYSDDLVYITYTKASLTSGYPSSATAWNKGGVMRLVTNNDPDPYNWFTSSLIDDVGPITTSVARIQDRNNSKLWVFFGEGRYFYPGDERSNGFARKFYGVQDPCYDQYATNTAHAMKTTAASCGAVDKATIQDQSGTTPASTLTAGKTGWSVNMATTTGTSGDERVVSDVAATFNGLVFYTTYTPNTDICTPGGVSSLWAVQYNTGGTPAATAMKGKAPIQTSSGGIKLIDLSTSFTQQGNRKLDASLSPVGMAPKGKFPPLLSPKPSKQILQIREN